MMVGCNEAINWVMSLNIPEQADKQDLVVNRMMYEFEKDMGATAKKHKGKYMADFYTCGNCGASVNEPHWKYCPNCGYRIIKSDAPQQTDCPWK